MSRQNKSQWNFSENFFSSNKVNQLLERLIWSFLFFVTLIQKFFEFGNTRPLLSTHTCQHLISCYYSDKLLINKNFRIILTNRDKLNHCCWCCVFNISVTFRECIIIETRAWERRKQVRYNEHKLLKNWSFKYWLIIHIPLSKKRG